MGVEARFQAIPEDCHLLRLARENREIAEKMPFLEMYSRPNSASRHLTSEGAAFAALVDALVKNYPDLPSRYYYAARRKWDAILYLLSPVRRAENYENDTSLIYQAIKGCEPLCPEAYATQGRPIGFVPAQNVQLIADYLDSVTYLQLNEYFDRDKMAGNVYKSPDDLSSVWDEFAGMRYVYRAAANHHEAMIVTID